QIEARLKLGQEALPKETPAAPTLEEYYVKFKTRYLDTAVRVSTRDSYDRSFRIHILPTLGLMPIDEIRREDVKDFVANLVQKKYTRTVKVKTQDENGKSVVNARTTEHNLSRATIRIVLGELTLVVNHVI